MNVVVTNNSDLHVKFGNSGITQLIISWSSRINREADDLCFWTIHGGSRGAVIRLHEKDMSVILTCEPQNKERLITGAEERHPLEGWGFTYLKRLLNFDTIILDNDPVYEESLKLIAGVAVHASRRLRRYRYLADEILPNIGDGPESQICIETWRVINSAKLLFAGANINTAGVSSYVDFLASTKLCEDSMPNSLLAFLKKRKAREGSMSIESDILRQIQYLAMVVLVFAHVVELDTCRDMPLVIRYPGDGITYVMREILESPTGYGEVQQSQMFDAIIEMLSPSLLRKDSIMSSGAETDFVFLCSDYGWSVFFDTVGDVDPGMIRPELVHIQKGTPTKKGTNERKSRVYDGYGIAGKGYPDQYPLERGMTYTPRAAARVRQRTEYWVTQAEGFELTLYFSIDPAPEWLNHHGVETFEESTGYRTMQELLWRTYSTPPCDHPRSQGSHKDRKAFKLGPDTTALLGWSDGVGFISEVVERILICLTLGQARIRWLAVVAPGTDTGTDGNARRVMLRTEECCEECALEHTASLPGRWSLIL
ncbi:MAG: hypothetical protein Q9160_004386 [Pyrenula sp. 1 TL-2023]